MSMDCETTRCIWQRISEMFSRGPCPPATGNSTRTTSWPSLAPPCHPQQMMYASLSPAPPDTAHILAAFPDPSPAFPGEPHCAPTPSRNLHLPHPCPPLPPGFGIPSHPKLQSPLAARHSSPSFNCPHSGSFVVVPNINSSPRRATKH